MESKNRNPWIDARNGSPIEPRVIKDKIVEYTRSGGTVYVGADSMLCAATCSFASVIAFHNNDLRIATYFYKKKKITEEKFKDVKVKILHEVDLALDAAQFVVDACPNARLEIHVDISTKKKHLTSRLYSTVKGWVGGLGYNLKVKPDSWAYSYIADWHTK